MGIHHESLQQLTQGGGQVDVHRLDQHAALLRDEIQPLLHVRVEQRLQELQPTGRQQTAHVQQPRHSAVLCVPFAAHVAN